MLSLDGVTRYLFDNNGAVVLLTGEEKRYLIS